MKQTHNIFLQRYGYENSIQIFNTNSLDEILFQSDFTSQWRSRSQSSKIIQKAESISKILASRHTKTYYAHTHQLCKSDAQIIYPLEGSFMNDKKIIEIQQKLHSYVISSKEFNRN